MKLRALGVEKGTIMVCKKLAIVIAAIAVLQANMTNALGLGELSLLTSLNQPLAAEIRLQNTAGLDDSQIIVRLAEPEDFNNAGISRNFFLTGIDFKVELDGQGNGVIKLSSRDPVVEPYLNFLIETRWPDGRLLREYTALLDLPVLSEPVAAVSSSLSPQADTPPAVTMAPNEKYRVRSDDTLWRIALKSRPATGVSVQQTMLAIQRLNPQAFNDNINHLKAGSILRLPTQDDISVSEKQALSEVENQIRSWRSGLVSEARLDASSTGVSENTYSEQARLSIASRGETNESSADEGEDAGSAGSAALQSELAASEENLDKAERDNQELHARLDDMEARMAILQRLLELRESQLADLQNRIDDEMAQARLAEAALSEQLVEVAKPKPAPAPKPEPALVDQIWNNPLYAGGVGALLLAAIAIVLLRRRKPAAEAGEDFTGDENVTEAIVAVAEIDTTDNPVVELEQSIAADNVEAAVRADVDETETPLIESAEPLEVVAPTTAVSSDTGDAIAEAEIYVAFGHYQQAIDLLRSALDQEPNRIDLQLKLLKIYIETRDKLGFQQQYLVLQGLGDDAVIGEVKAMLANVEGIADWLNGLPGNSHNFTDKHMGLDLNDLDLADLDDIDLFDLEAEFGDGAELSAEPFENVTETVDKLSEVPVSVDLDTDDTLEFSQDTGPDAAATDSSATENSESETFDKAVAAEAGDDDFDFLADSDEVATKLDLARAYIDMGDTEGARDILDEVMQEGSDEQKQEAQALSGRID